MLLLEPPEPLDAYADRGQRRDEEREEHADGGGLERPHAAQAGELEERKGRGDLVSVDWVGEVGSHIY